MKIKIVFDNDDVSLYGADADMENIDRKGSEQSYANTVKIALAEYYPDAEIEVIPGTACSIAFDGPPFNPDEEMAFIASVLDQVWGDFDWLVLSDDTQYLEDWAMKEDEL